MVDSDAVDAQLGHASDIAFALICVNERVIGDKLISDAWSRSAKWVTSDVGKPITFHVVLSAILVEELGTNGVDLVNGSMSSRGKAREEQRCRRPRGQSREHFEMI